MLPVAAPVAPPVAVDPEALLLVVTVSPTLTETSVVPPTVLGHEHWQVPEGTRMLVVVGGKAFTIADADVAAAA